MSFTTQHALGDIYVEVFVNPSKKELMDASKVGKGMGHDPSGINIRFLADLTKKTVWAWSPSVTHHNAWGYIMAEFPNVKDLTSGLASGNFITGVANFKNGKWNMIASDIGVSLQIEKNPPEKWEWVNKYIYVTDFLKGEL